jgi:hypothetical protein
MYCEHGVPDIQIVLGVGHLANDQSSGSCFQCGEEVDVSFGNLVLTPRSLGGL